MSIYELYPDEIEDPVPAEPAAPASTFLTRPLAWSSAHWELLAYVALVLFNLLTHLLMLGKMALHHDESLHAWMSWKFYSGAGATDRFECGFVGQGGEPAYLSSYCYNPVYHGPTLYILTFISYFLFGDSDATARLPMALAGVGLVASCWMLRPLIGKRAALVAGVLLTLSPTVLYFTRFARHDALILLWTFWMMVSFFRYLQERRGGWMVLFGASAALAWATHELFFIVGFILATFVLVRLAYEILPSRTFVTGAQVVMLLLAAVMFWDQQLASRPGMLLVAIAVGGLLIASRWMEPTRFLGAAGMIVILTAIAYFAAPATFPERSAGMGGMAMIFFTVLLAGLFASLRWTPAPLLNRMIEDRSDPLWRHLLLALGAFVTVFVLCFSVFFTYPQGILDGLTDGLQYWLSQHDYRRGGQPWFYYLMLLPVYEPLALLAALIGMGWWLWDGFTRTVRSSVREGIPLLFASFLIFWSITALVIFSWAGEKMPWLVVHMTLPFTLVAALVLGRLLAVTPWPLLRRSWLWATGPAMLLILVGIGIFLYRLSQNTPFAQSFGNGLIPIIIGGFILPLLVYEYGVRRMVYTLGLFGVAGLMLYSVRSAVYAAYIRPDVPVELLVYTQTGPDVPIISQQIHRIAENRTRNERSKEDPTGGHTMPVVYVNSGDGSLSWPFLWYLRDFQEKIPVSQEQLANATPETFANAPVVLLPKGYVGEVARQSLEQANYVEVSDTVFNWWFPESGAGYKDRLLDPNYCKPVEDPEQQGRYECTLNGLPPVLTWLFNVENWDTIARYYLFRTLPDDGPDGQPDARIGARELLVFMRCDVAPLPTNGCAAGGGTVTQLQLAPSDSFGGGAIQEPRGAAVASDGTLYIADAIGNTIVVVEPSGATSTITGTAENPLREPSAVALDADGNLYVANTWGGTVDVFDPDGEHLRSWGRPSQTYEGSGWRFHDTTGTLEGNEAAPLGFYGPRGIAVDGDRVYLTDTGNKRVVVTDLQGTFITQWGSAGGAPGQFNEPVGIAVSNGQVYVGDTWNGRVQVFAPSLAAEESMSHVSSIEVPGWSANTYNSPYIAASDQGIVAVAVPEQNEVQLFSASGRPLMAWTGGSDQLRWTPSGLAFNEQGALYVSDRQSQSVQRFGLPTFQQ